MTVHRSGNESSVRPPDQSTRNRQVDRQALVKHAEAMSKSSNPAASATYCAPRDEVEAVLWQGEELLQRQNPTDQRFYNETDDPWHIAIPGIDEA